MPPLVRSRVPSEGAVGVYLLVTFFTLGALTCVVVACALLFPGRGLEAMWRIKPEARVDFQGMGVWAVVLMVVVGSACALAAAGLAVRSDWGRRLAVGVLAVNLVGDLGNAVVRHDLRALIGLPVGGAMIGYLLSRRVRRLFGRAPKNGP